MHRTWACLGRSTLFDRFLSSTSPLFKSQPLCIKKFKTATLYQKQNQNVRSKFSSPVFIATCWDWQPNCRKWRIKNANCRSYRNSNCNAGIFTRMLTQNNQNLQKNAETLVIEIWFCFLYASSSDCDLSWRLKYLHNTRVMVQNFKISKIWNFFICSTTGAYPGYYKGVGYLKPFQQGWLYFYCAKGR